MAQQLQPQHSTPSDESSARNRLIIGVLALSAMLAVINGQALSAFLPFVSDDLDTSVPLLGQIATMSFLIGAAGGFVIGPLADRYGQRRFQITGAVLVIVSSVGTAAATSFTMLLLTRLISALSLGLLIGVTLATAATIFSGDEQRKAMSWVIAGQAIAPIIGMPFLTMIAAISDWRVSFLALAAVGMIVVVLQRSYLPHVEGSGGTDPFRVGSLLAAYRPLFDSRPTCALLGAHFMRAITFMCLLTYFGAYLQDTHGLSAVGIGWAFMVGGSGYFAGSIVTGRGLIRMSLRPLVAITTLLTGVVLSAGIALPLGAIGATLLIGVAAFMFAISFINHLTLLARESPAGRATTMSFNGSVFALGSAGGGAAGGLLIALGGYSALALGPASFALLSALLVWQPQRRSATNPVTETAR